MARSIVTRVGDSGDTGLLYGQRRPKHDPQIEAVGACDELNVALGAVKLLAGNPATRRWVEAVQKELIALMGEIACAESDAARYGASAFARVTPGGLRRLDRTAARLEAAGLCLDGWASPGANPLALAWDQARVAARRSERRMAALAGAGRTLRPVTGQWINRLSDVLWLFAREAETKTGR